MSDNAANEKPKEERDLEEQVSITEKKKTEYTHKHPEIDGKFWILKEIATTLGETGGDWFSFILHLGFMKSAIIFMCFFVTSVGALIFIPNYNPFLYWTVMLASSCLGTNLADYFAVQLELGADNSAIAFALALVATLALWKVVVGNIGVNKMKSRKAEVFYWVTILISNILGTAFGDYLAHTVLGFIGSWLVVAAILLVIVLLHFFSRVPKVILFWMAFVFSRPFGISFADILTYQRYLNIGLGYASLIFLIALILGLVITERQRIPYLRDIDCSCFERFSCKKISCGVGNMKFKNIFRRK